MDRSTLPKLHEWDALMSELVARMKREHMENEPIVAIQVVWPVGVHGVTAVIPGCVKLAVRGLRLNKYVVRPEDVHMSEVTVNGLPLVFIDPQHPASERKTQDSKAVTAVYTRLSTLARA